MIDALPDRRRHKVRPAQGGAACAAKGVETLGREPTRATKRNAYGVKPFTVNTTTFKDILFRTARDQAPGPRICTPGRHGARRVRREFFAQLGAGSQSASGGTPLQTGAYAERGDRPPRC
jgi:hypothetical protein